MNRTRTLIASFCLAAFVTGPAQSQVVSTTPPPPQSAPSGQAPVKAPPSKVASHPARPIDIRVENGAVSATLATPADVVEVGKAIPFTLTITATEGANLTIPEIGQKLGEFDIRDVRRSTSRDGEKRKSIISFNASTYESGEIELPPIEIKWKDLKGEEQTLSVGPSLIEVLSLIGAEFDPHVFRDIKGEMKIDFGTSWWWIIAIAAVVLLALLLLTLRMRQRAILEKVVSPDEWALQELNRLERDGLVQQGELHLFWVRLSGTVREYVERRFHIAAPEQTTKEFLAQASQHPFIGAEHRHLLKDFLRAADMVKFAAHRPENNDCIHGLDAARGFVRETTSAANSTPEKMEVKL